MWRAHVRVFRTQLANAAHSTDLVYNLGELTFFPHCT